MDNEIIIYCLYIYLHYINYSIKNNNMRLLSPHIYIYIYRMRKYVYSTSEDSDVLYSWPKAMIALKMTFVHAWQSALFIIIIIYLFIIIFSSQVNRHSKSTMLKWHRYHGIIFFSFIYLIVWYNLFPIYTYELYYKRPHVTCGNRRQLVRHRRYA